MRVKVGPAWVEMGPGRAIGGAGGVSRELGGRNVGQMTPDAQKGPNPQLRSSGDAAKLGIAPRRWNGSNR